MALPGVPLRVAGRGVGRVRRGLPPNLVSVQFWCYFDRLGCGRRQFAVLARGAAEAGGLPTPDRPYAQPVYRSAGELREVLAELFALQDLATAVVVEKWG